MIYYAWYQNTKNDLGLWEAEATLDLPEVKVIVMKAEKDQIKYDL